MNTVVYDVIVLHFFVDIHTRDSKIVEMLPKYLNNNVMTSVI